jgi:hypothetical protein
MPRIARYVLVWTVAFSLTASAAAWSQCTAIELAAASMIAAKDAGHQANAGHAAHDHAMHHEHASDAPPARKAVDHDCMKCCSMCTITAATLPAAAAAVSFTVSQVVFFAGDENWSGHSIAVDPRIPKRIA